jgi:hypothetical protein
MGLMLTISARIWATTEQREREAQLFAGHAYRMAIVSYYASGHQYPAILPSATGIMGVVSSSQRALIKRKGFDPGDNAFTDAECYCSWRFIYHRNRFNASSRPPQPACSPPPPGAQDRAPRPDQTVPAPQCTKCLTVRPALTGGGRGRFRRPTQPSMSGHNAYCLTPLPLLPIHPVCDCGVIRISALSQIAQISGANNKGRPVRVKRAVEHRRPGLKTIRLAYCG